MKKLLAAVALTGLFAAGTLTVIAQAPKKEDAKPTAKAEPKADPKAASKGTITIKPDAKGRYRLLVKDADGKGFLMTAGNGFETEKAAREAIEEAKAIFSSGKVVVEKADEK